ncbi:MAG: hypothetical protein M1834_001515 [Cirrosporium novae-zelandiae]|nr:MAG: hypothetical protein M1834_004032 [Cirrosporium novae-zelandiae]KAI9735500.1 MAG: hypothetical protein M1834_001515 [Cirrosporium novae-zelandiae]
MASRLFIFVVVALYLTTVIAHPVQHKKRSFKVPIKRSISKRNGLAAIRSAYTKHGIPIPEAWTSFITSVDSDHTTTTSTDTADNSTENGDVSATASDNAAEFISPVTIGGQTLNLDFDTGSSDLWVFSTLLANGTEGHTLYNPNNSTTYKRISGATFDISYGDGSGAAGIVGTDVVDIGGSTVDKQAVELATTVSGSFATDTANNGLVGLGFSSINTVSPTQQKTFFENVMDDLSEPLFTADLHESGGTYEFGTIDTTKFSGNLSYIPIDSSDGFWQFTSTRFSVGTGSAQKNSIGSPAIADTGTSLILVDTNVATAYYEQVTDAEDSDAAGGFIFPCDADLPSFNVGIGDSYMAKVSGDLINFAEVGSGYCFGGVQSNSGADIQIYGDVFFRSQFVVFDGGNNRLGVAKSTTT